MTDTLTQTPAANPTGSPLANPLAARDHARAMGGTVVESMPVLPPVATDLPEGVAPKISSGKKPSRQGAMPPASLRAAPACA
jgi:hypothetical protein